MQSSTDYNDFITLIPNYHTGISCDGNKPAGQCVLNVAVDENLMSFQPLLSLELKKKSPVVLIIIIWSFQNKSMSVSFTYFGPSLLLKVTHVAFSILILTENYFFALKSLQKTWRLCQHLRFLI